MPSLAPYFWSSKVYSGALRYGWFPLLTPASEWLMPSLISGRHQPYCRVGLPAKLAGAPPTSCTRVERPSAQRGPPVYLLCSPGQIAWRGGFPGREPGAGWGGGSVLKPLGLPPILLGPTPCVWLINPLRGGGTSHALALSPSAPTRGCRIGRHISGVSPISSQMLGRHLRRSRPARGPP